MGGSKSGSLRRPKKGRFGGDISSPSDTGFDFGADAKIGGKSDKKSEIKPPKGDQDNRNNDGGLKLGFSFGENKDDGSDDEKKKRKENDLDLDVKLGTDFDADIKGKKVKGGKDKTPDGEGGFKFGFGFGAGKDDDSGDERKKRKEKDLDLDVKLGTDFDADIKGKKAKGGKDKVPDGEGGFNFGFGFGRGKDDDSDDEKKKRKEKELDLDVQIGSDFDADIKGKKVKGGKGKTPDGEGGFKFGFGFGGGKDDDSDNEEKKRKDKKIGEDVKLGTDFDADIKGKKVKGGKDKTPDGEGGFKFGFGFGAGKNDDSGDEKKKRKEKDLDLDIKLGADYDADNKGKKVKGDKGKTPDGEGGFKFGFGFGGGKDDDSDDKEKKRKDKEIGQDVKLGTDFDADIKGKKVKGGNYKTPDGEGGFKFGFGFGAGKDDDSGDEKKKRKEKDVDLGVKFGADFDTDIKGKKVKGGKDKAPDGESGFKFGFGFGADKDDDSGDEKKKRKEKDLDLDVKLGTDFDADIKGKKVKGGKDKTPDGEGGFKFGFGFGAGKDDDSGDEKKKRKEKDLDLDVELGTDFDADIKGKKVKGGKDKVPDGEGGFNFGFGFGRGKDDDSDDEKKKRKEKDLDANFGADSDADIKGKKVKAGKDKTPDGEGGFKFGFGFGAGKDGDSGDEKKKRKEKELDLDVQIGSDFDADMKGKKVKGGKDKTRDAEGGIKFGFGFGGDDNNDGKKKRGEDKDIVLDVKVGADYDADVKSKEVTGGHNYKKNTDSINVRSPTSPSKEKKNRFNRLSSSSLDKMKFRQSLGSASEVSQSGDSEVQRKQVRNKPKRFGSFRKAFGSGSPDDKTAVVDSKLRSPKFTGERDAEIKTPSPKAKSYPLKEKVTSGGFRFGFSFKGDKMFGSKTSKHKDGKKVAFGINIGGDASTDTLERSKKSAAVKRSNTLPLPKTSGAAIREKYRNQGTGSSTLGRSSSTRVPGAKVSIERRGVSQDDAEISIVPSTKIDIEPKFPNNNKKKMDFIGTVRPQGGLHYDVVSFETDRETEVKTSVITVKKERTEFDGFNYEIGFGGSESDNERRKEKNSAKFGLKTDLDFEVPKQPKMSEDPTVTVDFGPSDDGKKKAKKSKSSKGFFGFFKDSDVQIKDEDIPEKPHVDFGTDCDLKSKGRNGFNLSFGTEIEQELEIKVKTEKTIEAGFDFGIGHDHEDKKPKLKKDLDFGQKLPTAGVSEPIGFTAEADMDPSIFEKVSKPENETKAKPIKGFQGFGFDLDVKGKKEKSVDPGFHFGISIGDEKEPKRPKDVDFGTGVEINGKLKKLKFPIGFDGEVPAEIENEKKDISKPTFGFEGNAGLGHDYPKTRKDKSEASGFDFGIGLNADDDKPIIKSSADVDFNVDAPEVAPEANFGSTDQIKKPNIKQPIGFDVKADAGTQNQDDSHIVCKPLDFTVSKPELQGEKAVLGFPDIEATAELERPKFKKMKPEEPGFDFGIDVNAYEHPFSKAKAGGQVEFELDPKLPEQNLTFEKHSKPDVDVQVGFGVNSGPKASAMEPEKSKPPISFFGKKPKDEAIFKIGFDFSGGSSKSSKAIKRKSREIDMEVDIESGKAVNDDETGVGTKAKLKPSFWNKKQNHDEGIFKIDFNFEGDNVPAKTRKSQEHKDVTGDEIEIKLKGKEKSSFWDRKANNSENVFKIDFDFEGENLPAEREKKEKVDFSQKRLKIEKLGNLEAKVEFEGEEKPKSPDSPKRGFFGSLLEKVKDTVVDQAEYWTGHDFVGSDSDENDRSDEAEERRKMKKSAQSRGEIGFQSQPIKTAVCDRDRVSFETGVDGTKDSKTSDEKNEPSFGKRFGAKFGATVDAPNLSAEPEVSVSSGNAGISISASKPSNADDLPT